LGTGNDLARTLALATDPVEVFDQLLHGETRHLDLIHVTGPDISRYALNVAAGGFSGQVNELMSSEMKATWGPLAYLRSALAVLPDLTNYRVEIAYDDEPPQVVDALNVIIANGRTAAGGVLVAPTANPEDGLLDVVIVHDAPIRQLIATAATLLLDGNYLKHEYVTHRQATTVRIDSTPSMWFNTDGELLTNASLTFTVRAGALPVVVGPEYQAIIDL
jgi:diacylglycerol kinase (ATP)